LGNFCCRSRDERPFSFFTKTLILNDGGYSFFHKYSEKQLQSLKMLLHHLGNKHNIDIREVLPNLIRKKGVKAFDRVGTKMCADTPGVWSHANVNIWKLDVCPQEGLVDILMGL
jgi:hypothetical protein